jgi:hypothetical protein
MERVNLGTDEMLTLFASDAPPDIFYFNRRG